MELRSVKDVEVARWSHICAVDDFLRAGAPLQRAQRLNELRALLAMEAGIHPVFIDCPNLELWATWSTLERLS